MTRGYDGVRRTVRSALGAGPRVGYLGGTCFIAVRARRTFRAMIVAGVRGTIAELPRSRPTAEGQLFVGAAISRAEHVRLTSGAGPIIAIHVHRETEHHAIGARHYYAIRARVHPIK